MDAKSIDDMADAYDAALKLTQNDHVAASLLLIANRIEALEFQIGQISGTLGEASDKIPSP